jgi:hypothetical protein
MNYFAMIRINQTLDNLKSDWPHFILDVESCEVTLFEVGVQILAKQLEYKALKTNIMAK